MSSARYRALVVAAHPDDIEFGCAGTLAAWVDEGAEVTYCIVTDGSTGTQDRALMGENLSAVRRAEAEAAAEVVGARGIRWLGHRDGYVEYTLDLRRDIARVFRSCRPHRYMVMDPAPTTEDRFINHPDHRAVGLASLDVTLTAGTTPGHFPELLDEGLEPWRGLREVWIAGPGKKPVIVDISTTIERKIDALLCHKSQLGDDADAVGAWIKDASAGLGKAAGFDYGESFNVIRQGPGFHSDAEPDEADFGDVPHDPRSNPTRRSR
jgi:LmbE family N-acetylglucosaminyl deacetylase